MRFDAVKLDLYFAVMIHTLHRCFQNGSEKHYINISEISLKRGIN